MILYALLILLFTVGVYKAIRMPQGKPWLLALVATLVTGAADVAVHLYYESQNNCGAKYNLDIGCANILPGWLVLFGVAALFIAVGLSLVIIFMSLKTSKPKK